MIDPITIITRHSSNISSIPDGILIHFFSDFIFVPSLKISFELLKKKEGKNLAPPIFPTCIFLRSGRTQLIKGHVLGHF